MPRRFPFWDEYVRRPRTNNPSVEMAIPPIDTPSPMVLRKGHLGLKLTARTIPGNEPLFELQLPRGASILEVLSGPQLLYVADPAEDPELVNMRWIRLEDAVLSDWDQYIYIGHDYREDAAGNCELFGLFRLL